MKNVILAAVGAALAFSSPASAQSAQEQLDERYNRALAAGYKALMLCGAIANAEAIGGKRTPESVHEWELTGIYPVLDPIIRDLSYRIERYPFEVDGPKPALISHVAVEWADDMPPRIAQSRLGKGCNVKPIGFTEDQLRYGDEREYRRQLVIPGIPSATIPEYLSGPVDDAFDGTYGKGSRTTAVIIRHDDRELVQQYAQGFGRRTPQRTWSVAKSIAATLVGMAVQAGEADVSNSAGLGQGEADPRNAITIDHALRMASGRYSDTAGNRTDPLYWGGTTVEERPQTWPILHQPGTVFRYANNDTLAAAEAVQPFVDGTGLERLRDTVGMLSSVAEADWQGNYVLSSQMWATATDLASLGQFYLDGGEAYDGAQILPENWREYVSDPSGPQPEGTDWGYGAGWWTFRRPEGNAFEGIPDDAFAARGNRGQYVVVVPSRDVVIVRRGEDMVGTRFDIAAFTRDVLAALENE
ncbi:MAG: serine hydrolase [Pseudomonadota bacterium]